MTLKLDILVNCRFCAKQSRFDNLYSDLNCCSMCERSDIDVFAYIRADGEYNLQDVNNFMMGNENKKPFQHKLGTFFKFSCGNCSNEGFIHNEQNFCPICLKRSIRKTKDINSSYSINNEIWVNLRNLLQFTINKQNLDKLNKYISEEIPFFKTCEQLVTRIQTYPLGTKGTQTTKWIGLTKDEMNKLDDEIENDPIIEEL